MPPRLEPMQRVPCRSVSCSCLSGLLDEPFDATRIYKSAEQRPWMSGASLFVESAELVQRRRAAGSHPPPTCPREAWFTLELEGRLPPATGEHRDGIAPGAWQPSETEVSRQCRRGLYRLVGRSWGRLFVRQCRDRLCAADRGLCAGGADGRRSSAADPGDARKPRRRDGARLRHGV